MFQHLNVLPRCLKYVFQKLCENIFSETFYRRFKNMFEDVLTFKRFAKWFKKCF